MIGRPALGLPKLKNSMNGVKNNPSLRSDSMLLPVLIRTTKAWMEETQMNAGEDIRDVLIARKMRRWLARAKYPAIDPRCPTWRSRKNFWRLIAKHPHVAARFGLNRLSVFEPL